ncbi:MAG: hypothetical protein PHS49_05590 [Candidatus Gracilibacteria bacterium]|nr:hypothetical protein [Candidatus Gracilibacteria bacterium]
MNFNFLKKKKPNIFKEEFFYNFRILILVISVIMIWRGVWNLIDHYFFPDDFIFSNVATIVLGIIIMFMIEYDLEALGVGDDE